MTGAEIQALASSYVEGDKIEDADALKWINDFIHEPELVLEVFRKTAEQELEVSDTLTWHDRTAGHLNIVQVLDSMNDKYRGHYELNYERGKIRFPTGDTFTITSIIQPTALTVLTDTPDVNVIFHEACASYVAGKFRVWDDPDSEEGQRLIFEGINKAKQAGKLLQKQDLREHTRQVRDVWSQ